ncbi:MAG: extracellular solute-binding protein, partial [Clostridia bacterium]|nr:extracellular solute-binding protein [Clostridia bacterium]
ETGNVKAGYYKLGFSFRQSAILGAKVYRSLKIDGECPFAQADNIGFKYSYDWQQMFFEDDKGNDYLVYLSEGNHLLSLEVTAGDITLVRNILKETVAELSDLYVEMTMITGETVDIYRDYDLFEQIPDMESRLKDIYEKLGSASKSLQELTGEKSGSYISIIDNMRQITKLMIENRYTAHRYKDEYYSKYTSLGSILFEMTSMPLDIDKISLVSPESDEPFETAGIFKKFGFSVKKFLVSFFQEYNSISGKETDDKGITIWVNWGRDQAQVLNSLIKSEFTQKSGISVNVQMVNASVVQAILSGKGPDCLLQQSRSEPVNLAMRGMLYNLKEFDDCDEVLKNFQGGAELPYYYKGGLYALPDTQSFYLMFYRKDILEEMDLPVPNTWEEFNDVAKIITRNNLTVWLPNNTATSTAQANIGIGSINLFPTLLVQKGLQVYADDGRSTNLSDPSVIKVFREWTDLYSKLKLPRTMDFYNRFRTGTCPLGVNTYSLYTTLKAAAPEIDGLWSVAFVPGSVDESGKINHASTGGGAACCILDMPTTNAEYAWQFLKWWVSSDTQLAYSSEVESILGPTGRITVSNVEAFKSLEWDPEMEEVIVQAMLQAEEIPEYPGSYYVSRSVYQAFWNVVENNQNAKQTLLKFAAEADDEIARKWKQYENR